MSTFLFFHKRGAPGAGSAGIRGGVASGATEAEARAALAGAAAPLCGGAIGEVRIGNMTPVEISSGDLEVSPFLIKGDVIGGTDTVSQRLPGC